LSYGRILAKLRKENGLTQPAVAEHISSFSNKPYSFQMVSHWENGVSSPPVEQFLLMCELYGVKNIQWTFRGIDTEYSGLSKLNALGKSRVEEYITMLSANPLFSESISSPPATPPASHTAPGRHIRLYDVPVAAGSGSFLDSDAYEEIEVDDTVPGDADFAVRVSGDSMEPRFIDGQIVFIRKQQTLAVGEVGIFEMNGDAYIKKLGQSRFISLNPRYKPIMLGEFDSVHVFGKVVG